MRKLFSGFLSVLILSASGCIPLVIGAAAGVGGYAWMQGELAQDLSAATERVHRASSKAMRDLKIAVYEDTGDRISARIVAKFTDGTDVNIQINAKTEYQSVIKIRVGVLGDKEKSELILNAIKKRL